MKATNDVQRDPLGQWFKGECQADLAPIAWLNCDNMRYDGSDTLGSE
jgi:hypothetical protein